MFANGQQITNINGSGNDYLVCALGDIDLDRLYFTQSADTLILVHEDMSPKSIVRGGSNSSWTFATISLTLPKHAFTLTSNPSATITPDAVDGTVKYYCLVLSLHHLMLINTSMFLMVLVVQE